MIAGLAYLLDGGVAHLDVKPENLVYTNEFELQIIDINTTVRMASGGQMVERVYGTENWTAPEI